MLDEKYEMHEIGEILIPDEDQQKSIVILLCVCCVAFLQQQHYYFDDGHTIQSRAAAVNERCETEKLECGDEMW